ncbi:MAG: PAS domain S-box protein [Syntrophomonas sp.]|nr:PAS domain S-box protein [Syntrophomonas sp.]
MKGHSKSKEELSNELQQLRQVIHSLELNNLDIIKRYKKALADNLYFRSIPEMSHNWVYWASKNGDIVYSSAAGETITGYKPQEIQESPHLIKQMVHPADRELWDKHICWKGEQPSQDIEFRIITRDGETRWISHSCQPIYDASEHCLWIGSINQDITTRKQQEEHIKALNESYERLTTYVGEVIFRIRADNGQIIYANTTAEKLLGYSLEDWLSNPRLVFQIIHPDSLGELKYILNQMNQGIDIIKDITLKLIAHDGYEVILAYTSIAVRNQDGTIQYYETIIRDITGQKKLEEALLQSEALYRMVVEDQTELICRFQKDGSFTFVNEAFCRYFSISKGQLIGSRFRPWVLEEDRNQFRHSFKAITIDNPVARIEQRIRMPNGRICWQQWNYRALFDDMRNIVEYQVVGRDITESKLLEEKLQYLGLHDALTGLHNRAYFDEEMIRLDSNRFLPVGVIVADIDGLKIINDTLGHQSGDELIKSAATVLKSCFRDGDVVARIGGDEFAVLLAETSKEVLEQSGKRILETLEEYRATSPQLPLSISIGYAVKSEPDQLLEKVFAEADNQMYTFKASTHESTCSMINDKLGTIKE